jgi:hypothetical protein
MIRKMNGTGPNGARRKGLVLLVMAAFSLLANARKNLRSHYEIEAGS